MKLPLSLASVLVLASSCLTAEIAINDHLSVEGFIDLSYSQAEIDGGPNLSEHHFGVNQAEIAWLFDFNAWSARIDLQYEDPANVSVYELNPNTDLGAGNIVEQAFVSYELNEGRTVTAGRYASMLGVEAFEPTGLYQDSTAYYFFRAIAIGTPRYLQGVRYTHETFDDFFSISLHDSVTDGFDDLFGDPRGDFGVEAMYAHFTDYGLGLFAGGAYENGAKGDAYIINTYATLEIGAFALAAELIYGETDGAAEGFSGLLMANFTYSESASVTGRFSFYDQENEPMDRDGYALTLAHGFTLTDNLFLVAEISYAEETADDTNKILFGGIELLFSF